MAEPRWAQYNERRDAANHPDGNEDVFNRAMKDFYTTYGVKHNDDGTHKLAGTLIQEQDQYTGNATDDTDIALNNANLLIYFIMISRPDTETPVFKSVSMAGDTTKQIGVDAFAANMIQDITTAGQFTIGNDNAVNENGIVYSYYVWGVKA